jgi:hypothetical protein
MSIGELQRALRLCAQVPHWIRLGSWYICTFRLNALWPFFTHGMALLFYLQDKNVLPIYAEIIGGQPTIAKSASGVIVAPLSRPPSTGIIVAPRSRPPSGPPLGAITKATSSSGSGTIILEGRYMIKETGVFAGWLWKDRWVSLTSQALVIHRRASKVRSHLPYLSPSRRLLISVIFHSFINLIYLYHRHRPLPKRFSYPLLPG